MKIYLASSWRNAVQPGLVERLRAAKHEVYDFRNPNGDGPNTGFGWQQIDPDWRTWTLAQYKLALSRKRARDGFESDERAMVRADACVLCMPAGRSAHVEFGWMLGRGQLGYVLLSADQFDPDLMYLLTPLARICTTEEELFARIAEDDERIRTGEVRPEYDLHTLRPVERVTGTLTGRFQSAWPNMTAVRRTYRDSASGRTDNPIADEVVIEGGTCNLPVSGPPLLVYVVEPTAQHITIARAAADDRDVGLYGQLETVILELAATGYIPIPANLRGMSALETVPKGASVYIHAERWKQTGEWLEQVKQYLP